MRACVCVIRGRLRLLGRPTSKDASGMSSGTEQEKPGKVIERRRVEHFLVLSFAVYRSVDR